MFKRTYGWVQNPSDFNSLKSVVQIFDSKSVHYENLKDTLVPELIIFPELRRELTEKLNRGEGEFLYQELVGTSKDKTGKSASKRKDAVADGLIQVSILPQSYRTTGKRWTDNWTADGYLRWALSLNLVKHDRNTDLCSITERGLQFSESKVEPQNDPILIAAILSYPPASRVLQILNDSDKALNKFEIGALLGFKGEKGFTSYSSELMERWFVHASSTEEQKKLKSDVEGTADKYARMIATWLEKIGFVQKEQVYIQTDLGEKAGFLKYSLTAKGIHAYRRSVGSSKNSRVEKYINWEFLAVDGRSAEDSSRDYVRSRRAYILQTLATTKSIVTLKNDLESLGFRDSEKVIRNDIAGLNSIGIRIAVTGNQVHLLDKIIGLDIPDLDVTSTLKDSSLEKRKNAIIDATNLPLQFYELVDIAYESRRNRDFEILTIEFFREVCGLEGEWLGGARRPDGVVFSEEPSCPFGIIVDTKAYSNGYSKSIQQEDEMVRYIQDNALRNENRNPTKWWERFGKSIDPQQTKFLWVSSYFIGRFQEQLEATYLRTNTHGAAIAVDQLLIVGDLLLKGEIDLEAFAQELEKQKIISFREV